jgi:NAD(P)H-dependent FMN reductase
MARLLVVVAAGTGDRIGPQLAEWFAARVKEHGWFDPPATIELASAVLPLLEEPSHPVLRTEPGAAVRHWAATVAAADAFAIVLPEYNRGYPGVLKNALDLLDHEWRHKPVALVAYGPTAAGQLAVQALIPVLTALRMVPIADVVAAPMPARLDQAGRLHPDDTMTTTARTQLAELHRLTKALLPLRTQE